ncbi:MAG: HI1506-related protein [Syntrophobacteraceae bacterium]
MIRVRSKIAGFRRAGIAHPADWVEYPDDTFTPKQLLEIIDEPMLQVEIPGHSIVQIRDLLDKLVHEDLGNCKWHPGASSEDQEMVSLLDELKNANLAMREQLHQQLERISQLELTRDALQDEVNVLTTDKQELAAEVERLQAKPVDKSKGKREAA